MTDPDHPAYHAADGEIDVPVQAGDLVIGDARLLHASHANKTDARRTVITLWYYPAWDELPESIRAHVGGRDVPASWQGEPMRRLGSLYPAYEGTTEPTKWNRIPGGTLQ